MAHPHSGTSYTIPGQIGIWKCWFLRREEYQSTWRKSPLEARKRTNNKLNAHNRRGSKIDTDRFPKQAPKAQASIGSRGTGGRLLQDQISTWKVFFITKNIFVMKNLTDFRKTVEAGVDPCLHNMASMLGFEPKPHWWEAIKFSHLCAIPCSLKMDDFNFFTFAVHH